ncbi:hypothetical protein L1987_04285 [Smallanthus sonchifolius]|uniref:Uncharacterized protein n=1 Tax=Smallanthus sonchifolius TaxID=185202 RepID=A0ACB9KCY8_9ASTR|nr:hypothetical protein L1987_04285 [Smallanthus sonchifolius]
MEHAVPSFYKKVFDYAFLHGVQELEADIVHTIDDNESWTWPIWSSDSLTSLKLQSKYVVGCLDLDPFSGFPALDKLRLLHCNVETNGKALNVNALQLSEFTFVYYNRDVNRCEFTTPKLRYFEWGGNGLPRLNAHLPVLDTVVINYNGHCYKEQERIMLDNLLMMFNTFYAAKSLTVSAPVVHLLTLFPVNGCSPLCDLKCLKLDFSLHHLYVASRLFFSETSELVPGVKAYLLHKSHDAKCTIINDPNAESPCSSSHASTQRQAATQQAGPFALSRPKRMVRKPTRYRKIAPKCLWFFSNSCDWFGFPMNKGSLFNKTKIDGSNDPKTKACRRQIFSQSKLLSRPVQVVDGIVRACFSAKLLQKVFDYTFLHGVEELEANIVHTIDNHESWTWPIWSSDSLTSLKLRSQYIVGCSFLEPRSAGSFKNLTNLHLECAIIRDLDPFSGFPALDKLRLVHCYLETNGNALNVIAPQLSEFTFFYYHQDVNRCEFTTPKLKYFKWGGDGLPRLKAHLPVLDTAVINYNGHCYKEQEKIMFDNLLMMFNTLYAAKSLMVYASIVHLLTLFPVNGCSPFRDLKCLKLDFSSRHLYNVSRLFMSETLKLVPCVKDYLLHKSHDANCTIVNDPNAESPCASSHASATQQAGSFAQSRPKRMVKKPARFLFC